MKTRKRQIARAGIFGSLDNPTVVKESELQEIAETFKDIKKAPIKLGNHWSDDRPRLGNVIAVTYDKKNTALNAEIEEHDTLAQAVDDGYYPDVSIGAKQRASDGKMYLHHLAYLGNEPPAIKDLQDSIDGEMTAAEKELAASDAKNVRVFPSMGEKMLCLSDPSPNGTTEPQPKKAENKEAQMSEEEIKAMQEENARLKAEAVEKEKLLSDSFRKQRDAEKEALKKAAEGKVPEAEMEKLLALADSYEQGKTIELSDGSGKRTASPVAVLAEIFGKMARPVEPGELNLSDSNEVPQGKTPAQKMMGNI